MKKIWVLIIATVIFILTAAQGIQPTIESEYPDLYASLGENLIVENIESSVVKSYLRDIQLIPVQALEELKLYGVRIYVGDKPVSDFPGMVGLDKIHVPGWGDGITFKDISGVYTVGRVYLGAGKFIMDGLAIHEIAHAIGDVKQIYSYPKMQAFFEEYQQVEGAPHNDSGNAIEEFFAESVREILMGQGVYKADYVKFIQETLTHQ